MKTQNTNVDLFECYDSLPEKVKAVFNHYSEFDQNYENCVDLQKDLNLLGFDFDFGLDAVPFNLRIMNINLQIAQIQSKNLDKIVKLALESTEEFHEISKMHAKALFNNNMVVYYKTPQGLKQIETLQQIEEKEILLIN